MSTWNQDLVGHLADGPLHRQSITLLITEGAPLLAGFEKWPSTTAGGRDAAHSYGLLPLPVIPLHAENWPTRQSLKAVATVKPAISSQANAWIEFYAWPDISQDKIDKNKHCLSLAILIYVWVSRRRDYGHFA